MMLAAPNGSLPRPYVFTPVGKRPLAVWERLSSSEPDALCSDKGPLTPSVSPKRVIECQPPVPLDSPHLQPDSHFCSRLVPDMRLQIYDFMLRPKDQYIHMLATWEKRMCSVRSGIPKIENFDAADNQLPPQIPTRIIFEGGGASRSLYNCFQNDVNPRRWASERRRCGVQLWNLLQTCRLLYKEITDELYSRCTFLVTHIPVLPWWERTLRKSRLTSIRRLHLGVQFVCAWARPQPYFEESLLCVQYADTWWEDACHTLLRMTNLQSLLVRLSYSFMMPWQTEAELLSSLMKIWGVQDFRVLVDWCNEIGFRRDQKTLDDNLYQNAPFKLTRYLMMPLREANLTARHTHPGLAQKRSFEHFGPPIYRNHQIIL